MYFKPSKTQIAIFVVIIVIFIIVYIRLKPKSPSSKSVLNQKEIDTLYYIIDCTVRAFDKFGITYYLIGGTLLGAVRHGGLISWDDDGDIAILADYEKVLLSDDFQKELQKYGLALHKNISTYKISLIDSSNPSKLNFPFLDIFTVKKRDGKWVYSNPYAYISWSKEVIYNHELFPLKNCKFGPLTLKCPNDSITFLKRAYGDDVLTHYYQDFDHKTESRIKKIKKQLTSELLIPNLPSY